MDAQIAPIALLVATAWGTVAENSWCIRNTKFLMETDDMRAMKRLRTMIAGLDTITGHTREPVIRCPGGWEGSTLYGYVYQNPNNDKLHRQKFRTCMQNIDKLCDKLQLSSIYYKKCEESGRPASTPGRKPAPLKFRVAACLYTFAHGGEFGLKADVAGVAVETLRTWLYDFCAAVQEVIEPVYMPSAPPSDEEKNRRREQFASRRGIPNVALACDGTHVRFVTSDDDYRNYKGWHSILVLAFVNSFHLFVSADIGWPGRAGDGTALKYSKFMEAVRQDRQSWIGDDVILGDGGASDGDGVILNPYRNPTSPDEFWFNFCHSSTRFYVEETFGRWKNRWRFLLSGLCGCEHALAVLMIHVSMVLHNFVTVENILAAISEELPENHGEDGESSWATFYDANTPMLCPSCKRLAAKHCVHVREYNRLTKARQATRHYREKAPSKIRDELRDELWRSLDAPVVLDPSDTGYLDMVAAHNEHARVMRERALTGKYKLDIA
jgi:hypothetical protein